MKFSMFQLNQRENMKIQSNFQTSTSNETESLCRWKLHTYPHENPTQESETPVFDESQRLTMESEKFSSKIF